MNIDYDKTLSIVGETKNGKIIAEARFVELEAHETHPEFAIVVDENYQNFGITTFICTLLMRLGKEKQLKGFKGYLLSHNIKVLRVIKNMVSSSTRIPSR